MSALSYFLQLTLNSVEKLTATAMSILQTHLVEINDNS
jgi:hypothetical protein